MYASRLQFSEFCIPFAEFVSQTQVASWLFAMFMFKILVPSSFSKDLFSAVGWEHNFEIDFKHFRSNKSTFLSPEMPRNEPEVCHCGSKIAQRRPKATLMCKKCTQIVPKLLRKNEYLPFLTACNRILSELWSSFDGEWPRHGSKMTQSHPQMSKVTPKWPQNDSNVTPKWFQSGPTIL